MNDGNMVTTEQHIEIIHRFYQAEKATFEEMTAHLLAEYLTAYMPVRMFFFGAPADNREYIAQFDYLKKTVKKCFGDKQPIVSYVAQPVDTDGMVMEVHEIVLTGQDRVIYQEYADIPYIVVEHKGCKRLFLGGVVGDILHQNIREQSDDVFNRIHQVLDNEEIPVSAIVRQWNYIEKITDYDNVGHQHYQDFNDARSLFYANVEWKTGYPAATGIGTQCGGIMVDMDVLLCKDKTVLLTGVDNPLQVAAHAYSQQVLLGETILQEKTTPKFERAKAVWKEDHGFIYISGTAAIRGEQSLERVGIEEQTLTTLENIDYLLSNENLQRAGISVTKKGELTNFRVYVKHWKDLDIVRRILEVKYPKLPVIYTLTDVCRSELLIEIEGTGLLQ